MTTTKLVVGDVTITVEENDTGGFKAQHRGVEETYEAAWRSARIHNEAVAKALNIDYSLGTAHVEEKAREIGADLTAYAANAAAHLADAQRYAQQRDEEKARYERLMEAVDPDGGEPAAILVKAKRHAEDSKRYDRLLDALGVNACESALYMIAKLKKSASKKVRRIGSVPTKGMTKDERAVLRDELADAPRSKKRSK